MRLGLVDRHYPPLPWKPHFFYYEGEWCVAWAINNHAASRTAGTKTVKEAWNRFCKMMDYSGAGLLSDTDPQPV